MWRHEELKGAGNQWFKLKQIPYIPQLSLLGLWLPGENPDTYCKWYSMTPCDFFLHTCIFPWSPVLSIRLATFTVLPQMSYWGRLAPITPATTGPTLIPVQIRIRQIRTMLNQVSITDRDSRCHSGFSHTHSQNKLVVGLVVDFVQNVKHLDGVVCNGAEMFVNGFFGLNVMVEY